MATDPTFANGLVSSFGPTPWTVSPPTMSSNPMTVTLVDGATQRILLVHSMRVTAQQRTGARPSLHNRPPGEWHAQMIFDGSRRGAGQRNQLQHSPNATTVLVGFVDRRRTMLHVAYDSRRHQTHAYSKSLQVKEGTLADATKHGIALAERANGEVLVAYREEFFPVYLEVMSAIHGLSAPDVAIIQYVVERAASGHLPQSDVVRIAAEAVREPSLRKAIHAVYDCWHR